MFYVYILYSKSIHKYYVGYTGNLNHRLEFHNSEMNNIWSKRGQPWVMVQTFSFNEK